jgi:mRNA-degrading endonuclease RelE of RelBE toxin-antitoxin system
MAWTLRVAKRAQKDLARPPERDRVRLLAALNDLARDPYAVRDVVALSGHVSGLRLRVGAYRILYDLRPGLRTVDVSDIARRSTTTYRQRR